MLRSLLLVAATLACAEGAALVRYINTVPTRTARTSVADNFPDTPTLQTLRLSGTGAAGAQRYQSVQDRVGLYYFSENSGAVSSPTIVWTQLLQGNEVGATNAPYAWYYAMPPLRGYHTQNTLGVETAAVDQPLSTVDATLNRNIAVDQWDVYEHTRLKADGVGLYLSFAPGTYRMQAYTVMSDTTAVDPVYNNAVRTFTTSSTSFTFEDNKVYTIIAYGTAQYSATTPLTGATVRLAMINENVAPTTFGMAALRFFHAIQPENANAIDVYLGATFGTTNRIVTGIAFGTVSNYVDVAPGLAVEFPLAVPGSSVRPVANGVVVQRNVRAGMRATVICAVNDETTNTVFCRAIPSRAVAYVRLVHDAAGQTSLVQGKFGSQRLSETSLSLWASYEFPRPEQVYEQSQVLDATVMTNHPATTEGLYPVVRSVAPGVVSGYGEVFVPLFIMDYAVRFVVGAMYIERLAGTAGTATEMSTNFVTAGNTQSWFWFAPMFKRVHFVLKTDGMATLTGRSDVTRNGYPFVGVKQTGKTSTTTYTGVDTMTYDLKQALTIDEYVEPGQYYTVFATASNTVAGGATLTLPLSYQDAAIVRVLFRLDRTVNKVAEGITANRGVLTLVPFVRDNGPAVPLVQNFATAGARLTLSQTSSSSQITPTLAANGPGANYAQVFAAGPTALITPTPADNADIPLDVGTYSFTYTQGTAPTDACLNNILTGGSITIANGGITDLFVLNTYGCRMNNQNTQALRVVIQTRQSAMASGHSPIMVPTTRAAVDAAVPLYNAAASSAASLVFAALVAAALALLAL